MSQPKSNEALIQHYTTKFWKKYDTKAKPRVMRGMERISKDVVDTFQMMLTEALAQKDKEVAEAVKAERDRMSQIVTTTVIEYYGHKTDTRIEAAVELALKQLKATFIKAITPKE